MKMTTVLLEKMKEIADRHVKRSSTDFQVDAFTIRQIAADPEMIDRPIFWIVLECGTRLGFADRLGDDSFSHAVYRFYIEDQNARYYMLNIVTGELKQIDDRQEFLNAHSRMPE